MPIIIELHVPPEDFELGDVANATVDFERTVTTHESLLPYLWVRADDHVGFAQRAAANKDVERLVQQYHDDESDSALYKVEWAPSPDNLLGCLETVTPVVLSATGSQDGWSFRLRFTDHDDLSAFQRCCRDHDISLSVQRLVTDGALDVPTVPLTDVQRETVEQALSAGYFDVPRKITMVELAEDLEISDQAVSARLRRASKNLLEHVLDTDGTTESATGENRESTRSERHTKP